MEGTDNSSRGSSRKPIYVKTEGEGNTDVQRNTDVLRQRWTKCRFKPCPPFLFFSFLFPLTHSFLSLHSRLSVAMATVPAAEEERTPGERKRRQRRNEPKDEDG